MNTAITDCGKHGIKPTETPDGSFLRVGELGSYGVEWSNCSKVTPMGGMAYFGHFLHANGLFDDLVDGCPLRYTSNNAPGKRRVLGTLVSGILNGAWRYAHLSHIQGDRLCADTLEIKGGFASEDSVRRGLRKGTRTNWLAWDAWLSKAELAAVLPLLSEQYILDLDTSVKLVYGHQEGSEIGYNPTKPGRPSQALHVGFIGGLRLLVAMDVQGGKKHAACHMAPQLWKWVDALPPASRPRLIRGDIGFGNERVMAEMEAIGQRYLFKLKQTPGVKRLIERLWRQGDWQGVGQGFDAVEGELRLAGWSAARRVVVLRQPVKSSLVAQTSRKSRQPELQFLDPSETTKVWEYAVLVTNADYSLEAMGQLYRDRADCENGFDELKNQWGWGGYTTQDLERCNLSARAVALIYNWWSWYVRLAHPKARLEAITSRPLLLAGVARLTQHAGKSRLLLTLSHAAGDQIKAMIASIRKGLDHVRASAPQLPKAARWPALVRYIVDKIIAAKPKMPRHTALAPPGLAAAMG